MVYLLQEYFCFQKVHQVFPLLALLKFLHQEILLLLLKKYIIILAMSFLIAISISYWGITIYLKDFAYKANISSWLFIIAAIIISLISILTLVYQVKKAARQNPAEVIKSE